MSDLQVLTAALLVFLLGVAAALAWLNAALTAAL